ncbi:ALC-interacting protein 1 [Abeliophyllum distichum]|uniref:ALC-interacting protein 1 n=1 Tax=Abeliophyllum distichum TaxID=126358 RepID=A0ABD1VVQ1_9LAMI
MANSVDANSTKCFSGVLRRLFCGGSLPTHPSDQYFESNNSKDVDLRLRNALKSDEAKVKAAESTPGVVARLMGLDSLPEDIKPKDKSLASYFRSRSVNSIDFLAQFDVSCKQSPAQHRRVRTAVSFREVPSLDLKVKHDFNVILHIEKVLETSKAAAKYQQRVEVKKPEVMNNYQQVKQKKGLKNESNQNIKQKQYTMKKCCKKLEEPKRVHVKLSSTTPRKKNFSRRANVDFKERRPAKSQYSKKKKNIFDDIQDYQIRPEATPLEVSRVLQCSNKSVSHCSNKGKFKEFIGEHDHKKTMKEESSYYNIKMVEKICNLTEDDLKESCWATSLKFEDFEEICVHYGQLIFELLLNQVVDELVLLHRR